MVEELMDVVKTGLVCYKSAQKIAYNSVLPCVAPDSTIINDQKHTATFHIEGVSLESLGEFSHCMKSAAAQHRVRVHSTGDKPTDDVLVIITYVPDCHAVQSYPPTTTEFWKRKAVPIPARTSWARWGLYQMKRCCCGGLSCWCTAIENCCCCACTTLILVILTPMIISLGYALFGKTKHNDHII